MLAWLARSRQRLYGNNGLVGGRTPNFCRLLASFSDFIVLVCVKTPFFGSRARTAAGRAWQPWRALVAKLRVWIELELRRAGWSRDLQVTAARDIFKGAGVQWFGSLVVRKVGVCRKREWSQTSSALVSSLNPLGSVSDDV